ncbi:MAG: anthranilate phosphoribosyltransferase [Phycisphaerales bacterium]|nr:anthranilate phosphoribosyltransferase [Phycisphaerales bacterium]
MRDVLLKLTRRQNLSRDEARSAFDSILSGTAPDAQIAGFLMGLAVKGVTGDELAGAAGVMREKVLSIPRPKGGPLDGVVLDTCGTGGTGRDTFNVSTAAAILVASCGVKVVKHGNRKASGVSGSADVLETLGVRLDLPPDRLAACLEQVGLCFAFARNHHPAMKHVSAARTALGVPTIFNILGPLTNPARACHQLLGVYERPLARLIAGVLADTGSHRAWVVHADDGLDELSTIGPTRVCEVKSGHITEWTLDPATLGLKKASLGDLRVSSPTESAAIIRGIMTGQKGPAYDIAALNAAAGLVITGAASDLSEGLRQVARSVENGNAERTLATLTLFV